MRVVLYIWIRKLQVSMSQSWNFSWSFWNSSSQNVLAIGLEFFLVFEKCYPFCSVELIFLLEYIVLINMNVLRRCVGTTACSNTHKSIIAAVLQIFAVFITWIVTTCGMLGLEIIHMQILWISSYQAAFFDCFTAFDCMTAFLYLDEVFMKCGKLPLHGHSLNPH